MRFLIAFFFAVTIARADLASYLARPEPKSTWKLVEKSELGDCQIFTVALTSQEWQGIEWKHDMAVFLPKDASTKDRVYLLNNGGSMKPGVAAYGSMLASKMKVPVAILLGIPNQPLFNGMREDVLIAETLVRYMDTKDATWPLLFPMVKSVVKSMDVIQELSAKEWGTKVEKFVVGGASKRGWTSWLTAASDPRVMAITPMVIDVLKMPEQMKHQVECFGGPSEQIKPYVARNLVPLPDTAEARQLWAWLDPWTYRAKYTMPKLIILGNNDRYWAPDALNLYWDDLPGPKYISYTPNAGHDLVAMTADGKRGTPMRAVEAAAAFTRHQVTGKPMPELTWKHDDSDGKMRLVVTSSTVPLSVNVWRCEGPTKDLRSARWSSRTVEMKDGRVEILETKPESGVVSFFADCSFEIDGLPYTLCTQLRMLEVEGVGGR